VKAAAARGGRVIEPPSDIPSVGRRARIADPQGAEISVFKSTSGDPPDGPVPPGHFLWNELHTTDAPKALSFYEDVLGFSHRAMDMGAAGAYYIISRGGADRGGVTSHLPGGAPPHWLPYVHVADVDATLARARRLGGTLPMNPEDIPGVGRIGILQDPIGAVLALIKPNPRQS